MRILVSLASAAFGLALMALSPHSATPAEAQRYCAGGSCDFDERTGRYRDDGRVCAGGSCDFDERTGRRIPRLPDETMTGRDRREPIARVGRPLCTDGFRSYECDGPGGTIGSGPLPSPDIRGPIYRGPDYRHPPRPRRRVVRRRHYERPVYRIQPEYRAPRYHAPRYKKRRYGKRIRRHREWGPNRYANRTRFCRIEKRGHGWHAKKVRRCIYVRNDLLGNYAGGGWRRH